jgi:hypothetical protein
MRAIVTIGTFSHNGKTEFHGLIVKCHIHRSDTNQTVDCMVAKINLQNKTEEPVLIAPYVGLYEKKSEFMNFDEAEKLFKLLASKIKNSTLLPLKYPEVHDHMTPPKAFLKFLEC